MATEQVRNQEAELEVEERADGTAVVIDPNEVVPQVGQGDDEDDAAPISGRVEDLDAGPTEAEELHAATDDAAREAIRARRRKERKDKRAAQIEREESLKRELAATRSELGGLKERFNIMDRKTSGAELAQLDHAIRQGAEAINHFKQLAETATTAGNGAAAVDALDKMALARQRVNELGSIRQRISAPQEVAPTLDPMLVAYAQSWMSKNKWYDLNGKDDDSRIVLALDQGLTQAGYQPNTGAYWQELDKRVAKHLPHRVGAPDNNAVNSGGGQNGDILNSDVRKPVRSVVTGSGREAAGSGQRGSEFVLSPERVQALKDAGYWEDKTQRNAMIKEYRDFDRKAANSKS